MKNSQEKKENSLKGQESIKQYLTAKAMSKESTQIANKLLEALMQGKKKS